MTHRPLHALAMFERMPATADDYAGVFSLDYLEAMRRTCRVTVLMPGRTGGRGLSGHATEEAGGELTWTPWLSGGGQARQRFARLEALVELSRLGKHLPAIDLIHAHGPIFHGSAALALGRKLAVPTVLTVHTGPFRKVLERRTVKLLTRRTLEGVDCVCPVSDDLRRQIETSGIRPRRIEVTYNPVNTDLFLPGQQNSSQTRRIVFAGRLEEYKGALRVIRAFSEIFERWPNWKLTIAGDGPERGHLDEFLRQHQALSERVEMLGSYTRPQLAALLAESDCFVYPSRHETFGIVLAEAMSAGLPVIGPDRTAPPEFIDSHSGLLVPPDDHSALTQAMERLLATLRDYRGDDIRRSIVDRFGIDAFGKRLLALYTDVCETAQGVQRVRNSRCS